MTQLMNESVSDGDDCRPASATPGLLKITVVPKALEEAFLRDGQKQILTN